MANHKTTVLAADHRPAHFKKDRDLDHAHAMGRIVPESGEVLTHYYHMFSTQVANIPKFTR